MGIKSLTQNLTVPRLLMFAAICLGIMTSPLPTQPGEKPQPSPYVILSGEFFTAMQKLADSGITYGDRQEPLLEQIALSGRYLVKTNLTLIQQNEKIIQLLEELNRQRLTGER